MIELSLVMVGKILFYISIIPLIIYSFKFYFFGFSRLLVKKKHNPINNSRFPKVSIHIPVYNDPVVTECVKHCLDFNYPKDKVQIIVADDSNDNETLPRLEKLKKEVGGFTISKRADRKGFKAGAMNNALKISDGEIIVVFDSDYRPERDFLRTIVEPFKDEKVGFVQARWEYLNPRKNRISRLAMTAYTAFHECSMPVEEKIGTAIFCGTGGAIRKSILEEVNGWNENTIAEDLDLSVRVLEKGYKQVYLPRLKAIGEVPETFWAFVKQQQRWAYGTTQVMRDYLKRIFQSPNMSKKQKIDFFFLTTGFLVFPFILGVTISTMFVLSAWFGPNATNMLFDMGSTMQSINLAVSDFLSFEGLFVLILSSGYIFQCAVALMLNKKFRDLTVLPYIFVVGLVVQITNTVAVLKALFGLEQAFYKTPKSYKGV